MVVDAIQGTDTLTLRLADGDTAWSRGTEWEGSLDRIAGPGIVTYREGIVRPVFMAAFDGLAGPHDPRCDAVNGDGDVCRLLEGDHLAHYWGES